MDQKKVRGAMTSICVVGSGPAGLIAARAVEHVGLPVPTIISASHVYQRPIGAQYLHDEIPMITEDPIRIDYYHYGTEDAYQEAVYGGLEGDLPTTSWSSYSGSRDGWDLDHALTRLRRMYPEVTKRQVTREDLEGDLLERFDLVIFTGSRATTFPLDTCRSIPVWVSASFGATGGINEIIYQGTPGARTSRISRISGTICWEHRWDFDPSSPTEGKLVGQVTKVIDCVPGDSIHDHPRLMLAGRQGKWDKSVLLHHVFEEVVARCSLL